MTAPLRVETRFAVDVLEAALAEHMQLEPWIEGLLDAVSALLPSSLGYGVGLLKLTDAGPQASYAGVRGLDPDALKVFSECLGRLPMIEAFYFDAPHVASAERVSRVLDRDDLRVYQEMRRMLGMADMLGLGSRVGAEHSLVLMSTQARPFRIEPAMRQLLGRATLHIEAGLRLRLSPSSLVAVVRPDGCIEHAEGSARGVDDRAQLTRHARTIEQGRVRERRTLAGVLEPWTALVSGQYGFVERTERGGRRAYLVFENPPHAARWRRLSTLQAQALELSARGLSGKLVAYALGVAPRVVSELLAASTERVGCANRTELVALASLLLNRDELRSPVPLTPAEREVLALLRGGLSNADIASRRDCSPRTVANQVASLLKKTRLPSRRALATLSAE